MSLQSITCFGTILICNQICTIIYFHSLFYIRRFEKLRTKNSNFKERWTHLGQLPSQTAFDWEKEVETEASDNEVNYT